jgi:alpha-glucosidase
MVKDTEVVRCLSITRAKVASLTQWLAETLLRYLNWRGNASISTLDEGRDGCRVPLPWTRDGKNFGYDDGAPADLPQPTWMWNYAVDVPGLRLQIDAQQLQARSEVRSELHTDETMRWKDFSLGDELLVFERPNGWLTVGGTGELELPEREALVASGELEEGKIPPETTVWLRVGKETTLN